MYIFITILIAIVAILLIFVVTIQESKGGGLASGFSASNNIMGVRKTTNVIEKVTWTLAGIMVVLCIISARFVPNAKSTIGERQSVIADQVEKANLPAPAQTLPFSNTKPTSDNSKTVQASSDSKKPEATTKPSEEAKK